jgi:hypothetical protein
MRDANQVVCRVVGVTGACLSVKVLSSNRKAGALAVSVWELSGAAMRGRFRDLWMLCLESPNEYNTIKNKKKTIGDHLERQSAGL